MAYELGVNVARIVYANPVRQFYKVTILRTGEVSEAVPAGVRRLRGSSVCTADNYSIGDLVIVAAGDQSADQSSPLSRAVILCAFPGESEVYDDGQEKIDRSYVDEARTYYEEEDEKFGYTATGVEDLGGFDTTDRGNVVSGDYHIHSKDAGLTITGLTTELGSTDSTISTNALDGSIRSSAIVSEQYTPGASETVSIINETVLKTTKVYGGLNGRESESFLEQTGDLPYGNIRTIKDANGVPLSAVEQLHDGSVVIRAATGIILERTVNVVGRDSLYSNLISYDKDIADKGSQPFERTTDSENWISKNRVVTDIEPMPVVRPVPDKSTGVEVSDVTGSNTKKAATAKATIAQYADGSIVLRDAWGSEIRMSNGDIQFSAANKITTIADTDVLTFCGGVCAIKADAGVQALTQFGHIELASAKELNLTASENINIVGDQRINIASLEDLVITSTSDMLLRVDGNYLSEVSGDAVITATTLDFEVSSDCTISTQSSIFRLSDRSVDIAAPKYNIHSDVEISDKSYSAGELPLGREVKTMQSSGGLRVGGTITIDSGLVVNGYATVQSSINAMQVNAVNVSEDSGVYRIKNLPKVKTETSEHESKSRFNKQRMEESRELLRESDAKSFLSRMFEAVFKLAKDSKNMLSVFLPSYVKSAESRNSGTIGEHAVASSGQTVYIYPGRNFWQGDSVYVPTKDDYINTDSECRPMNNIKTIAKESIYYGGK